MGTVIIWLLITMTIACGFAALSKHLGPEILIGVFAGSLVIAIVVAGKIGLIDFAGQYGLSASIFVYSATFLLTDVLSEVYGKTMARKAVYAGLLCYPMLIVTTQFSIHWTPHPLYENQEQFELIMGNTFRIVIASLCAYLASQLNDVWAFHFIRSKTGEKWFWLRNNLSTWMSQAIDTVIFYTIAFYGVFPVGQLIIITYIAKIIIALVDTPFAYLAVWYLRRGNNLAEPKSEAAR